MISTFTIYHFRLPTISLSRMTTWMLRDYSVKLHSTPRVICTFLPLTTHLWLVSMRRKYWQMGCTRSIWRKSLTRESRNSLKSNRTCFQRRESAVWKVSSGTKEVRWTQSRTICRGWLQWRLAIWAWNYPWQVLCLQAKEWDLLQAN